MTPIGMKEMLGTTVRARNGDELGALQDFVFDANLRVVDHVVVGKRAVLGKGDTFDVPLRALTLDTENECFVVDAESAEAAMGG